MAVSTALQDLIRDLLLPPSPGVLPFYLHIFGRQHPPPVIHCRQQVLTHLCQVEPGQTPQPERARTTCWEQREGTSLGETLVTCARDIPYQRHHLLLQPHPPSFPASLGTSTKIFQESVCAQLIIPCLSNAGEALVPSSTSALPLPAPLGPDPNTQADSSARPQTYLVVPRMSPTLPLSPELIPGSELPHHSQIPADLDSGLSPAAIQSPS